MALIQCKDCGSKVSSSAASCPHCGRPINSAKQRSDNPGVGFIVLVAIALSIWIYHKATSSDSPGPPVTIAQQAAPAIQACDPNKAECALDNDGGSALVLCKRAIDAKSAHTTKWSSGLWGDQEFPYVSWNDPSHSSLSLTGSAVQFQNDFGAWTPMTYSCIYDLASKSVLSAYVFAGKGN